MADKEPKTLDVLAIVMMSRSPAAGQ